MDRHCGKPVSPRLRRVFEDAVFSICDDGDAVYFSIGQSAPALDRLLRRYRAATLAAVTAHNPMGRTQSALMNRAADARLKSAIHRHRPPPLAPPIRYYGLDPTGVWPQEPGYLICDMPLPQALDLAWDFGQAAILWIQRDHPVRIGWQPCTRWRSRSPALRCPQNAIGAATDRGRPN